MANSPVVALLNEDGTASMATALMSSHHGLRRDLRQFVGALEAIVGGDVARVAVVSEEWERFRKTLHGHHTSEDTGLFPRLRVEHPEIAGVLDRLDADHRRIDPLLEQGDVVFAALGERAGDALALVVELRALLEAHLAYEEANVTVYLRDAKSFPAPASEEHLAMYADGFAWATHRIGSEICVAIDRMLPAALVEALPAARARFAERSTRVWGT